MSVVYINGKKMMPFSLMEFEVEEKPTETVYVPNENEPTIPLDKPLM